MPPARCGHVCQEGTRHANASSPCTISTRQTTCRNTRSAQQSSGEQPPATAASTSLSNQQTQSLQHSGRRNTTQETTQEDLETIQLPTDEDLTAPQTSSVEASTTQHSEANTPAF